MSQNTHNVRTRREQLSTYPESVCVGRYSDGSWQLRRDGEHLDGDRLIEGPVLYVRCDIAHQSQTEARGAEEQCSTNALQDVISERERQKSTEGWTEAHDDAYDLGEMASAASAYAYSASATPSEANILSAVPPDLWPWAREWGKTTTARRDLAKAAALILAEIERLDRATITCEGTE